jgi:hypothetical protein
VGRAAAAAFRSEPTRVVAAMTPEAVAVRMKSRRETVLLSSAIFCLH